MAWHTPGVSVQDASTRNMTRKRLAVLMAAALVGGLAVVLLAALLRDGSETRRDAVHYGGELRAGLTVLAVVDGVEITDAHRHVALAYLDLEQQMYMEQMEDNDILAEFSAARLEQIEAYGAEQVVFAYLLMDAALMAEVDRRGLNPPPDELAASLVLFQSQLGELDPDTGGLDRVLEGIDVAGEAVYWQVIAPAEAHLSAGVSTIHSEIMAQTIEDSLTPEEAVAAWPDFRLSLLREATIDVYEGPFAGLSIDDALAYLDDADRLVR